MTWKAWIDANWQQLKRGEKIDAPRWLGPPSAGGFRPQAFASPEGQTADWTLSLTDRSRIHIHEFADGRRRVHRDVHDPDQGFLDMIAHLFKETPWGLVGLGIGLAVLASNGKK